MVPLDPLLVSHIPAVLLVRREKTFPSGMRLDGCGDEGGVVSDNVALSVELDLGSIVKLVFLRSTGDGDGEGLW